MAKACRTQNYEKTLDQSDLGLSMNFREETAKLHEQTADKRGTAQKTFRVSEELNFTEDPTDLMVPPQEESWNSKTVIWLRPTDLSWHLLVLMTFREEPSIVQEHQKNGRPRRTRSRRPRSRRSRTTKMDWDMPSGKHHLDHGTHLCLDSHRL